MPKTGITLTVLFLSVFAVYYATAPRDVWSGGSIFYAMTARQLVTNGSVDLSDQIQLGDPLADLAGSWLTKGPGGLLSHYRLERLFWLHRSLHWTESHLAS